MGACSVYVQMRGYTMEEAFHRAVRDAEEEHGHEQGYSGAINCCDFSGDKTSAYKTASDKKKFVHDLMENAYKRDVYGICLTEPNPGKLKIKSVVKRVPQKGARIFETFYTAYDFMHEEEVIKPQKTLGEAIKLARLWTEKNHRRCSVYVEKKLIKGSSLCAEITEKSDAKKKEGVYIFVGQAPE
jgi:hypothetical protein